MSPPAKDAKGASADWGLLEPLRGLLGPVADLVGTRTVIGVLCVLVLWLWWRTPSASGDLALGGGRVSPARMAAYEEMWRREEGELWRWLENRVGAEGGGSGDRIWESLRESKKERRESGAGKQDMNQREVEEAIRVTKERLEVLEDVVKRRKDGK